MHAVLKSCSVFVAAAGLALAPGLVFAAESAASAETTPPPSTPASSTDVVLFWEAQTGKPLAQTFAAGDPALASAKPHPDAAKAAAGWQVIQISGNFEGYVSVSTARKDLTITPGTAIHREADSNSTVIGTAADQPPTTIVSVGGDWAKVAMPGPATVYFQGKPAPATPAPTPAVPAPKPGPVLPPPVVAPPITSPATPLAGGSADLPRYFYGILKLRTDTKLDGPSNAQYILVDGNGSIIAVVDLNRVILTTPLNDYLGKFVKVYGAAEAVNGFPSVLIKAQLVQQ